MNVDLLFPLLLLSVLAAAQLSFSSSATPTTPYPSTGVAVFPLPLSMEIEGNSKGCLALDNLLAFHISWVAPGANSSGPILAAALHRTRAQMLPCKYAGSAASTGCAVVTAVEIMVESGDSPLATGVDESYNLVRQHVHFTAVHRFR